MLASPAWCTGGFTLHVLHTVGGLTVHVCLCLCAYEENLKGDGDAEKEVHRQR